MAIQHFLRFLLGVFAVATCKLAAASLNIEIAGIKVIYPDKEEKIIDMAMADFGLPRYGSYLRGELVYISSVERFYNNRTYNCHPRRCEYGCDINTANPALSILKEPGIAYIVMLDRGPRDVEDVEPCYFLDKVYNAQMLGADAVLLADDKDGEITTVIAPDTDDAATELSNISIPAGMITKKDADYLRDQLMNYRRVSLLLNWTSTVPQTPRVSWEYWTGTADVCGSVCTDRVNFTKSMRSHAVLFEQSALTSFTPRYFLEKCKNGTEMTTTCQSNCFSNGKYCAEPSGNYTGKDVLKMNIRAKCFFNQASRNGNGYVWWEYMTMFFQNCSMALGQYNEGCAGRVFDKLSSYYTIGTRADWDNCSTNFTETDLTIEILQEDLISQFGSNTTEPSIAPVLIEPTIRINGDQYRGSLRAGPVMRALCAAFPTGHEPDVCNEHWVSEDECAGPNGEGYIKCGVGIYGGRTGCINTFQGYQCTCGEGFQMIIKPSEGSYEACTDINECAVSSVPYKNESCSCERCTCINTPGSYRCSGNLRNMCAPENHNDDSECWAGKYGDRMYTTCIDTIGEYKEKSYRGTLNESRDKWYRCGECPKCFRSIRKDGKDACELMCDLSLCDGFTGFCKQPGSGGAGGDGSGGGDSGKSPSKKSGDPGVMSLILVALGAAMVTGILVITANYFIMRARMSAEIRDIRASYMPLQEDRSRNAAVTEASGGGRDAYPERIIRPDEDSDEEGQIGAYGWHTGRPATVPAAAPERQFAAPTKLVGASLRAIWGPPAAAATSTAPTSAAGPTFALLSAPGAPAAALKPVTPKPSVDAFGEANDELLRPAAPPAAAADPLLGLQVVSSSSIETPAPSAIGKPVGQENPFR